MEESDTCLYDSLAILGDVEGTEEIAVLCGTSVPPPVLSYHSLMVLHFSSDSSVARQGFRAAVTFISHADLHSQDSTVVDHGTVLRDYLASNQHHVRSHGFSQKHSSQELRVSGKSYLLPVEVQAFSLDEMGSNVDKGQRSSSSGHLSEMKCCSEY
eukprot:XP_011605269.1 PREDICTED: zinc metalloproteinase nas-39-like [Takifugu rubripes]